MSYRENWKMVITKVEGDTVTNTLAVDPQSKLSTTWSGIKTRPWKQYFLD